MDGGRGYGNRNTIAVEICRNYDRNRNTTNLHEPLKSQYAKAEKNAIKVIAQLAVDRGIVANNNTIKTHNDWNGKWCPRKILNEKRLQHVKNEVIKEYNRIKGNPKTPSTPNTSVKPSKPTGGSGGSIVDYMNSKKLDSSLTNRKKLASKHGIKNFKGTSKQNSQLLAILKGGGGATPTTPSSSGNITVDGYWGRATTRKLQHALGTPADGVISKPSTVVKKLQSLIGTKADGYLGTNTYRKLQAYLGTPVDGKLSKPSTMVKALQRKLNAGTIKKGNKTNSSKGKNIKVDGFWGAGTTRKLQQAFGTPADGVISKPSLVIKKLQRLVGASADGYLGAKTYRKLQAYLGTPVDGKLSKPSTMVKAMQRKLNAGTFR